MHFIMLTTTMVRKNQPSAECNASLTHAVVGLLLLQSKQTSIWHVLANRESIDRSQLYFTICCILFVWIRESFIGPIYDVWIIYYRPTRMLISFLMLYSLELHTQ